MAFQVSPGVQVKEIDLTNVIPAVSSSIGAIAGAFQWGPVGEVRTVGSEKDLVDLFGQPNDDTYKYFMPAAQFLKYGSALRVVRTETNDMSNAFSGTAPTQEDTFEGDAAETQFTLSVNPVIAITTITIGGTATTDYSFADGVVTFDTAPADGAAIVVTYTYGTLIGNEDSYDSSTVKGSLGDWIAKYPGTLGNSLKVVVCTNSTAFDDASFSAYADLFSAAPGTSDYVSGKSGSADEMHIVVVDEDGLWTGNAGEVLETFAFVSQASDAKADDGTNNYYVDVINNSSAYIWFGAHNTGLTEAGEAAAGTTFVTTDTAISSSLANGLDDNAPTLASLQTAYDFFNDAETLDVSLLIGGESPSGSDGTTFANYLIGIAADRKDCIAFVSPRIEDTVNTLTPAANVKTFADALTSSSYGVCDSTALYVYDKYNDKYRWISASGAVAGLCANTDNVADAWFSPAGLNRGQLFGITKLAFNPKKADRDTLYKARVNPIVSFPGEGTVLFGDKTLLSKPSAFDRINVRRLFIVLEKAISTAAKFQLFEFNDEFTRAQFRNLVEPFLRDVKGRRGVTDFLVVCDDTNNTGQIIDSNQFVADMYVKPARSINFITLNFIATRTGVEFSEIAGQ